jgi:hypothetical protein
MRGSCIFERAASRLFRLSDGPLTDRIFAEPTATAGTDRSWLILLPTGAMTFTPRR